MRVGDLVLRRAHDALDPLGRGTTEPALDRDRDGGRGLDREAGIAVRNGCFCAQPYVQQLLRLEDTSELRRRREAGQEQGLPGAVRATFGIYNTADEVDALVNAVRRIRDRSGSTHR